MSNADTEKAWSGPIGATSPLWWAFAGAAGAGVAYWWMTRWARPVNFEAMAPVEEALVEAAATYELVPEAIDEVMEVVEAAAPEPVAPEALDAPADDLTRLAGIGPRLSERLAERGVTRFAQIADWTKADIAALDRDMKLMGRIVREAWVDQARAFATD